MEKYLFIIKNYEDENILESMKVLDYDEYSNNYWLKLKDGFASISKNRVVSIEKIIY